MRVTTHFKSPIKSLKGNWRNSHFLTRGRPFETHPGKRTAPSTPPRRFVLGSGKIFQFLAATLHSPQTYFFCTEESDRAFLENFVPSERLSRFNWDTHFLGSFRQRQTDRIWIVGDSKKVLTALCERAKKSHLPHPAHILVTGRLAILRSLGGINQIQSDFGFAVRATDQILTDVEDEILPNQDRLTRVEGLQASISKRGKRGAIIVDNDPDGLTTSKVIGKAIQILDPEQKIDFLLARKINRPENQALLEYLEKNGWNDFIIPKQEDTVLDLSAYDWVGFVDVQPEMTKVSPHLPEKFSPAWVVDHHRRKRTWKRLKGVFYDIRPDYGCCFTMGLEYLETLGVSIEDYPALALGGYYALVSDTNYLKSPHHEQDSQLFPRLSRLVDWPALVQIQNPEFPAKYAHLLETAGKRAQPLPGRDEVHFSYLGDISDYPDVLGHASQMIIDKKHKGIGVAIAAGLIYPKEADSETPPEIHFSGRSLLPEVDLQKFMATKFGGGGHADKAGGKIALVQIPALKDLKRPPYLREMNQYLIELLGDLPTS